MSGINSGKGLVLVYSEVGNRISEGQLHDSAAALVPRYNALPGFLGATRLEQNDGKKPTWAALFELTSAEYYQDEAYKNLRGTVDQRQRDTVAKVGYLERRIYRLIDASDTVSPRYKDKGLKEGGVVLFYAMDVAPDFEGELARWYAEEHISMLAKVPGWLRSRRYELVDSNVHGTLEDMTRAYKQPPKFLAIHEFEGPNLDRGGAEFKAADTTPWTKKVLTNNKNVEERLLKVSKPY